MYTVSKLSFWKTKILKHLNNGNKMGAFRSTPLGIVAAEIVSQPGPFWITGRPGLHNASTLDRGEERARRGS